MQLYIFLLFLVLIAFVLLSAIKREVIEDDDPRNAVFDIENDRGSVAKRHAIMFAMLVAERLAEKAEEDRRNEITDNPLFDKALEQFQALDAASMVDAVEDGKKLSEICLTEDVREYLKINV